MDERKRQGPHNRIRVVIADDHGVLRDGLKALLTTTPDIDVVGEAANGREAVRLAGTLEPDVIVMDISMPGMNGIEAVRVLAQRHLTARAVMLSIHSSPEHVFRAFEAGAVGYVLKKSAGREVIAAVRAAHAGRRYTSPAIGDIFQHLDSTRGAASPLNRLTSRERQVLQLVAEGKSSVEIAALMHLSPKTVETYRSRLMLKLGVSDVPALVKFALRHGLTSLD